MKKLLFVALVICVVIGAACAAAIKPIGRVLVVAGNEICGMIERDDKSGPADQVCATWDELSPFFKQLLQARKRAAAAAAAKASASAAPSAQ